MRICHTGIGIDVSSGVGKDRFRFCGQEPEMSVADAGMKLSMLLTRHLVLGLTLLHPHYFREKERGGESSNEDNGHRLGEEEIAGRGIRRELDQDLLLFFVSYSVLYVPLFLFQSLFLFLGISVSPVPFRPPHSEYLLAELPLSLTSGSL